MVISTNTLKTNKCFYLQAHLKKVYPLIPFMTWCCSAPGQFVLLIICTCCAGLFGCDEHVEGDVLLRLRGLQGYKENALHGRFPHDVDQEAVDKQASYNWLTHGELQPETEGFLIVIQYQVIKTNNYRKHILKDVANNTCRRCGKAGETIHHTLGGCQLPYQYGPRVILENENYEIYWDRTVITDRRLEHSRPDIVVKIRGTKM
nr:unnamed protein product [Callosobruchus chinensis]